MINFENKVIDLPNTTFPNRKFMIKKYIGQGSQGIVYQAQPFDWNIVHDVAIKISSYKDEKYYQLLDELIAFQQQYDQNEEQKSQIVKIYEKYKYQDNIIFIMELGQIDFKKFQKKKLGQLCLLEKIKIMIQLARPIKYIHDRQLLHGNLKPENYLQVGEEFKLIDFDLIQKNSLESKSKFEGTPISQAPKIQNGTNQYNYELDIYSLGVTFMEFFSEQEVQKDQSSSKFIIKPSNNDPKIEAQIKTLIQNMTNQTPQFRIKIDQVLSNLYNIENQLQNPFIGLDFQQNTLQMSDQKQFSYSKTFQQLNFKQPKNIYQTSNAIFQTSTTQANSISQMEIRNLQQQNDQIIHQLNLITDHLCQNNKEIQSIKLTIDSEIKINEKFMKEFQTQFQSFLSQFLQAMNQNTLKSQEYHSSYLNNQLYNLKEFFSQSIKKQFDQTVDQQQILLSKVERSILSSPIVSQYSQPIQFEQTVNIKEYNDNLKKIYKKQDEVNQLMLHMSLQLNNLNKNDLDQSQDEEQQMQQFEIFQATFSSKKQNNIISSVKQQQQLLQQGTNNLTYLHYIEQKYKKGKINLIIFILYNITFDNIKYKPQCYCLFFKKIIYLTNSIQKFQTSVIIFQSHNFELTLFYWNYNDLLKNILSLLNKIKQLTKPFQTFDFLIKLGIFIQVIRVPSQFLIQSRISITKHQLKVSNIYVILQFSSHKMMIKCFLELN